IGTSSPAGLLDVDGSTGIRLNTTQGSATAIQLIARAGGIDISTGTGTAGNDIDITAGASLNLTAQESVSDALVLSAPSGGIEISSGSGSRTVNVRAGGGQLGLFSARNNSTSAILLGASQGGIDISPGFDLGTAGNVIVRAGIGGAGNVGIGTTAPVALLHKTSTLLRKPQADLFLPV
ncbi:hypothetical protein HYZ78_00005, partial [Candidatus Microgenomates bacterium]|nr:hypothetical protein [Candidatus Microgenomates bacterium]